MTIEPGQPAPDFTLLRDGGEEVRLGDFRGRKVVLYFYPKDDTPGCTTEALGFSVRREAFDAADTTVLGISKDSVKSHERFLGKHGLEVVLLSDETGATVERYGAWVEKSRYGRTFMGIDRSTFLIGPDGRVARVWRNVKVPGHVEEVLAAAQAL
jgi:peroxiredoxin Q/BCP